MMQAYRSWIFVCALALSLAATLAGQGETKAIPDHPQDGPVVLWKGSEATVYRLRDDKVETEAHRGAFELNLPGLAAKPLRLFPQAPEPPRARFGFPPRILAVSDIHGRFDTLLTLLKAQRVIDEDLRWCFGKGHLVVVGDVMDRGPQVTEAYWFFRGLEPAAQRAGGRVHVMLGNHEAMVLNGDIRYVNSKYLRSRDGWPDLSAQMGPDSELGRWLRNRPALLKLGPFLFVHGGLSPEYQGGADSLERLNEEVNTALQKGSKGIPSASAILASGGPLWYRGLLPEGGRPQASDQEVKTLLKAFGAKAFVVGHTTLAGIGVFHGGRVYGIDAGIKEGRPGEVWLWEKGRVWRGKADGTREALQP